METRICTYCGKPFRPRKKDQRTCSTYCRFASIHHIEYKGWSFDPFEDGVDGSIWDSVPGEAGLPLRHANYCPFD